MPYSQSSPVSQQGKKLVLTIIAFFKDLGRLEFATAADADDAQRLYEELTTAALGLLNAAHSRLEESRNAIKREAGNEWEGEQWYLYYSYAEVEKRRVA